MTLVAHAAGQAPGWAFHLLVLLHVICVVGGFGPMVYRSVALDLGRRRGDAAAAGSLAVYGQISGLGEALVYLAGVFGLAAVAAGRTSVSFSKPWVGAAIAVYVVMVGVLHGLVRPAEKKYRATLLALAQEEPVPPPNRPPQVQVLESLNRRVAAGMGVFNVLLLAALYLMVFQP